MNTPPPRDRRVVWKYPLTDDQGHVLNNGRLSIPSVSRIVHVGAVTFRDVLGMGNVVGPVCLWVEVEPDSPTVERQFAIFPTGVDVTHPDPKVRAEHRGTFFIRETVWHVYEFLS